MNDLNFAAPPETGDGGPALSADQFARFASLITAELGIKMSSSKLEMIQSRLFRRLRELQLNSFEEYAAYFLDSAHHEEREHFVDAITTHKTDFFREPEHFRFLVESVLPGLAARVARDGSRVKLWSAGCSSGEEPYTLAMLLAEHAQRHPGFDFAILGTDVSRPVLETARRGIYEESLVSPVPADLRRRYLMRSRNPAERLVRIVPQLRRAVSFHQLNFMDEDYAVKDRFDIVFFRNVMIYFDRPTQEAVICKICRHLSPGGYFFGGHSESLLGMEIPLTRVRPSIYRKPL